MDCLVSFSSTFSFHNVKLEMAFGYQTNASNSGREILGIQNIIYEWLEMEADL